jgi:small GTP-binding protein
MAMNHLSEAPVSEFKIVLLGGPAVGKSALTLRMITQNFVKDYDPTIEDTYRKEITLDGEPCVLSKHKSTYLTIISNSFSNI